MDCDEYALLEELNSCGILDSNTKLLCIRHKEACYKCNPRISERLDLFVAKIYGSNLTDKQYFKLLDTLKEVFPEFNYVIQRTDIKYKCDDE